MQKLCFLNHTMKMGRDEVINKFLDMTWVVDKWQSYLLENYQLYWSHVWDHVYFGNKTTFMWFICHKACMSNE